MDLKSKIKNIIKQANTKKDYQQACYYIHDEINKMNLSWDYIELLKDLINKEYNTKLLY